MDTVLAAEADAAAARLLRNHNARASGNCGVMHKGFVDTVLAAEADAAAAWLLRNHNARASGYCGSMHKSLTHIQFPRTCTILPKASKKTCSKEEAAGLVSRFFPISIMIKTKNNI